MDADLLVTPLVAFGLSCVLCWFLVNQSILKILDQPNTRSLHTLPTPRTGGIGIITAISISWLIDSSAVPRSLSVSVLLLALVSLADDIWSLPVFFRLAFHSMVAWAYVTSLLYLSHGFFLTLTVCLALIWMINLFNFMDGLDGLAGGMALIGFGTYGVAALQMADETFATINFCVAAAAAAFLLFNFHPARIFMGDSGSIPLGFLAGALGLYGWSEGIWSPWFPLLIFAPFIADATVTLIKRICKGERIWHAHRDHYYQKLALSGWGHHNTALFAYVLMLTAGAIGLITLGRHWAIQMMLSVAEYGAYLSAMLVFDHRQSANSRYK